MRPSEQVMSEIGPPDARTRVEARAWRLARQSGWVLFAALLAASFFARSSEYLLAALFALDAAVAAMLVLAPVASSSWRSSVSIWLCSWPRLSDSC